ncbi:hypothetical protein EYR40_007326 [Pleurotus pulmonarius]|nr:hypothetical protein EYR40_007326 [Pleurotus pulmonarius]
MYDPIKTSLGALHISSGISAFFLGCLVLQAYRYFSDYPRDSRWIKSLVRLLSSGSEGLYSPAHSRRSFEIALMLLSELALHMTITEVSYIMTIIHAGDPFVFLHISSSQLAPPLFLSVLAIPMNEIFYYWRIYRLDPADAFLHSIPNDERIADLDVYCTGLHERLNSRPVTVDGEGDRMSPKAGEKEIDSLTSVRSPRFVCWGAVDVDALEMILG